jgi:hypothetical protein
MRNIVNFNALIGKIITKITGCENNSDCIIFECSDGTKYQMYHYQDCCESVNVEDICGDVDDLLNSPVLDASEDTSGENPPGFDTEEYQDSFTWTFYNIRTAKGHVTIRWYGQSNGYYSESVDFEELEGGIN